MAVAPADDVDVDGRAEMDRKRLPEFLQHLRLERADAAAQRDVVGQVGALAEVDHDAGQGFIERRVRRREARDPGAVSERLRKTLAEHDAGILDEVMCIYMDIAGAAEVEVEPSIPRDLFEQMGEASEAARDIAPRDPFQR